MSSFRHKQGRKSGPSGSLHASAVLLSRLSTLAIQNSEIRIQSDRCDLAINADEDTMVMVEKCRSATTKRGKCSATRKPSGKGEADINQQLLDAAGSGRHDNVRLLLQQGADVISVDEFGHTPLHRASYHEHIDTVRLLLQRGANVDAAGYFDRTPLHMASANGHTDTVHLLLRRGANVNAISDSGWTPLHMASQYAHTDIVRLLLRRGADVNAVRKDGSTPLHLACLSSFENVAAVRMLVDEGANINAVDDAGRTPLDVATAFGGLQFPEKMGELLQDVHGAVQDLSDRCASDATFDFERYFSSNQGNGYRLTEKAVEATGKLRTSRAYKNYTFEKARKRLRSQNIHIFANGQVREDGTIFPLTSIDIEALVRAFAVDTNLLASRIPGCGPD